MTEPTPGAKFGPYRIVRLLGEGGMGAVWEAVHVALDKPVAIKTLRGSGSADSAARFVQEGRAAARIRHPNVVDVTDVAVHEGTAYLVMSLLQGESLSALIHRSGALSVESVVEIALPVLDALEAAHALGVIHRDLKPDNIFITRSPTGELAPIVVDFGISKMTADGAQLTGTSAMMGTPAYMSPEQVRGARTVTPASDQYSLGLVLYEMLSGRCAIVGDTIFEVIHRITTGDYPPLSSIAPSLPRPLVAIVERMIARDASDRFASLREVGRGLLGLGGRRTQATWERAFGAPSGAALLPTMAAHGNTSTGPLVGTHVHTPAPQYVSTAPLVVHRRAPIVAIVVGVGALLLLLAVIGLVAGVVLLSSGEESVARAPELSTPAPSSPVAMPAPSAVAAPSNPLLGTFRGTYTAETTFVTPRWPTYTLVPRTGTIWVRAGSGSEVVTTGAFDGDAAGCPARAAVSGETGVYLPDQTCSGREPNGRRYTSALQGDLRVTGDSLVIRLHGPIWGTNEFGQSWEGTYTGEWRCTRQR